MRSRDVAFSKPEKPKSHQCGKAYKILCAAYDACSEFLTQFHYARKDAGPGSVRDTDQDLLRAMLTFACAGFDVCLKRLLADALATVIKIDPNAHDTFTENVRRKLPDIERSRDLLARVLSAQNPRERLIDEVLADLLSQSLQSVPQYARVAAAFSVVDTQKPAPKLKIAFEARNQIIHEMDVDFSPRRSRRQRKEQDMINMTKTVLESTSRLLAAVDDKIAKG